MKLRSFFAAGAGVLLAQTALAQPAPASPPGAALPGPGAPPAAAPGLPPGAPPAPYMAPYPGQPAGAYPYGAYPPGAYPNGPYPPGGYAPPGWGAGPSGPMTQADARPTMLRLEMPYDDDAGVPPGYKLSEKRRGSLILTGATTLGGLWVASAIAGGFIEDGGQYSDHHGWPMWIPVLGPFITLGTSGSDWSGSTVLVLDGVLQGAAFATLIAGMATSQKVLKYQFSTTTAKLTLKPVAAPMQSGGFAGITGSF